MQQIHRFCLSAAFLAVCFVFIGCANPVSTADGGTTTTGGSTTDTATTDGGTTTNGGSTTDSSTTDTGNTGSGGANGTYDILSLAVAATGGSSYAQGDALTNGTSADGYVSWTDMLYLSAEYGVSTKTGSTISVTVAGASVISFTGSSSSNGTVTVTDSSGTVVLNSYSTTLASDKASFGFLYTATAGTKLTLAFSGSTYINNLVVSALTDETVAVASIVLSGASTVAVGETVTLTPTVSGTYCPDTGVTWKSSDTSLATVSGGVVTGKDDGFVTITATSVQTPSISASTTIAVGNVPVSGTLYTYSLTGGVGNPFASDDGFLYVSAYKDSGIYGLIMTTGSYFTLMVLANATVTLTNCKYDAAGTITVTNGEGTTVGTITITSGATTDRLTQDWTYSGPAGTLTFTYTTSGQTYLHGIAVNNS